MPCPQGHDPTRGIGRLAEIMSARAELAGNLPAAGNMKNFQPGPRNRALPLAREIGLVAAIGP
jgi:hypothetical protein